MKKLSFITGAVLAIGLLASPAQAATDLPKSHGFYDEMTYLINKGVISGFEDGSVKPDKTVSRAEAAIMIGKLKGFNGTQSATKFKDVTQGQKASGYIAAAEKAGYITGYPDGTFKPNAAITRGDMAIILSRVFPMAMAGIEEFKDVSPNMRAYYAIGEVVSANIAAGYKDLTFKPNNATTRAQFSAFLARGLEPKFKNDTHMAHSYLKDKTKTYTYREITGEVSTEKYVDSAKYFDEPLGFFWLVDYKEDSEDYFYGEYENREMYITGFPEDGFAASLVYPITKGKTFDSGDTELPPFKITGVNVKVTTPYKTFTNAVEVSVLDPEWDGKSYKYYMAEGYGLIKTVHYDGDTLYELVDVK